MRRRNFLKGLAAATLAPLATIAALPAKAHNPIPDLCIKKNIVTFDKGDPNYRAKAIEACTKAMRKMGQAADGAKGAMEDMHKWDRPVDDDALERFHSKFGRHIDAGHRIAGARDKAYKATLVKCDTPNRNDDIFPSNPYACHIHDWKCNLDMGREELFELGRKGTYHRYVDFPVNITHEDDIKLSAVLPGAVEVPLMEVNGPIEHPPLTMGQKGPLTLANWGFDEEKANG